MLNVIAAAACQRINEFELQPGSDPAMWSFWMQLYQLNPIDGCGNLWGSYFWDEHGININNYSSYLNIQYSPCCHHRNDRHGIQGSTSPIRRERPAPSHTWVSLTAAGRRTQDAGVVHAGTEVRTPWDTEPRTHGRCFRRAHRPKLPS